MTSRVRSVGLARVRAFSSVECALWLSQSERVRRESIRNASRRDQWTSARLLAKFLYLNQASGTFDRTITLGASTLGAYPSAWYRRLEILPASAERAGCPRLFCAGELQSVRVSLAHSPDFAAAGLHWADAIGVDVESIAAHSANFYRDHFTLEESRLVRALQQEHGISPTRSYTLLWCLKESALKSRHADDATLLDLRALEVLPSCSLHALARLLCGEQDAEPGFDVAVYESGARASRARSDAKIVNDVMLASLQRPFSDHRRQSPC